MEEAMEPLAAEDSARSSFSTFSFRSEDSFHVGYHPPVSEYEEIPSLRWLSEIFLSSKPTPPPPPGGATAITTRYPELDVFPTHVADMLYSLVGEERRPPVSLSILRRLLEAFVCIEEEFQAAVLAVLDRDPALLRRPPVGRLVADLLDHTIGLLDVCRAVTQTLDSLQFCQRYAEVAAFALHPAPEALALPMGARFHRARKALSNLLAFLGSDENHRPQGAAKERAWLFGRSTSGGAAVNDDSGTGVPPRSRSVRLGLSLNISQNWSAARQVEAMWVNFRQPRGADATALAMAVYAMSAVVVLVQWILVLAFPCQGQSRLDASVVATGTARSLAPPWKAPWAAPMVALQERIAEEWRKERRGSLGARAAPSPGLLGELQSLVRCGRAVVEVGGRATGIPLGEEQWEEVGRELAATCRDMEEHLEPLQQQVRDVFRRVLSREEVLGLGSLRQVGPETSKSG
ncbi:hypothetical protein Taro_003397 [Colocasia esculenta]|uniref:Uncharacterized protein n=1 Tax=Colocasia esculenta TaxID=4460 RepID=A0A843TJL5_COLES|nr:hypothetical protein [Colocasia esculenta]